MHLGSQSEPTVRFNAWVPIPIASSSVNRQPFLSMCFSNKVNAKLDTIHIIHNFFQNHARFFQYAKE
jgi:hypothetical protein